MCASSSPTFKIGSYFGIHSLTVNQNVLRDSGWQKKLNIMDSLWLAILQCMWFAFYAVIVVEQAKPLSTLEKITSFDYLIDTMVQKMGEK